MNKCEIPRPALKQTHMRIVPWLSFVVFLIHLNCLWSLLVLIKAESFAG